MRYADALLQPVIIRNDQRQIYAAAEGDRLHFAIGSNKDVPMQIRPVARATHARALAAVHQRQHAGPSSTRGMEGNVGTLQTGRILAAEFARSVIQLVETERSPANSMSTEATCMGLVRRT